jgi:hypothetical protein
VPILFQCRACGHRHQLAAWSTAPGPRYLVCHDCERINRLDEVPALLSAALAAAGTETVALHDGVTLQHDPLALLH